MNRIVGCAIAYGMIALSSAIHAAQPVSEIPETQLTMTNEGCAAAAAVNRARCLRPANVAGDQSQVQCEDAINLRQRICMIEVLEALHPSLGRTPAQQN
jgi:hypothetical protein